MHKITSSYMQCLDQPLHKRNYLISQNNNSICSFKKFILHLTEKCTSLYKFNPRDIDNDCMQRSMMLPSTFNLIHLYWNVLGVKFYFSLIFLPFFSAKRTCFSENITHNTSKCHPTHIFILLRIKLPVCEFSMSITILYHKKLKSPVDFVSFLEILAETKLFKLMEKLKWYIQREKTNEDLWPKKSHLYNFDWFSKPLIALRLWYNSFSSETLSFYGASNRNYYM